MRLLRCQTLQEDCRVWCMYSTAYIPAHFTYVQLAIRRMRARQQWAGPHPEILLRSGAQMRSCPQKSVARHFGAIVFGGRVRGYCLCLEISKLSDYIKLVLLGVLCQSHPVRLKQCVWKAATRPELCTSASINRP